MKNNLLPKLIVAFVVFAGFAAMDQASARRVIGGPVVGTPTAISKK
jgi:hypothetical protein